MARVVEFYWGNDTFGRHIQVCKSDGDKWFHRVFEFNGFGKAWSKWRIMSEPSRPKGYTNAYDLKFYAYTDDERQQYIDWGFNKLERINDLSDVKYRLPN